MNYIGIDSSLTSTAISVKNENGYYFFSYFKNYEKPGKWTKIIEDFTKITGVFYKEGNDYSEQENLKLIDYSILVSNILSDLKNVLVDGECHIAMEGYSFASAAGRIIDLVTLGTLIRYELAKNLKCKLYFFSPSTLKKESCGLVYGWDAKRKVTRNTLGIAGGSFKKHQMVEALKDSNIKSPLVKIIKEYYTDLSEMKKIPHPIEDLVDSHFCLEVLIDMIEKNDKRNLISYNM